VKASEAELATAAIAHLKAEGWTVYEEVRLRGDDRCDLVATRAVQARSAASASGLAAQQQVRIACLEAKVSLSFDVLGQAERWSDRAHEVWVVVPKPKRGSLNQFALKVATRFGIGVMTVDTETKRVRVRVEPVDRTPGPELVAHVTARLFPEQIGQGLAGTNKGGYVTRFSRTCAAIRDLVTRDGPTPLSKAVKAISHHYANDSSAVSSLRERIGRGVVPGLRLGSNNIVTSEAT
jgi:hypothetical protein